ncbi:MULTISPECIES: HEPN family nuclease [Nostocales]|uniref:Uncharacterized protein n=1 Tax=Dolichospermum flos-aquae UHCC 0037 TaxID=2590026 RepID=A0ACC7S0I4_DOLFA|nr:MULTISPECIES: HEPN family nuclease [Nostocales]MBO1064027.1 hypothetical protein [Anabaena sp. 54]MTJ41895.1 hypothetical protein [Dolichospermum flos-aquae UHCC 0037]
MITHADNLILQAYYTTVLIVELKNNEFMESGFYQNMTFGQPVIKEELKKIGVDNQGSALMALYAMLVIPREILYDNYSAEYVKLNDFLNEVVTNTVTSYPSDSLKVDFIRHIRNSVAHAQVEFEPNDYVLFQDRDDRRGYEFETRLPLKSFGTFIGRCEALIGRFISDRKSEINNQG